MPELPELVVLSHQARQELKGKVVAGASALQPKCLNIPPDELCHTLFGKRVGDVTYKGKWLFMPMEPSYTLLINLGMGADMLYFATPGDAATNYQFRMDFEDGSGFTIRFWWFGHVHLMSTEALTEHAMTASLGPSVDSSLTVEAFRAALSGARGRIKSFLLNQSKISGVGNAYAHEILFGAGLHPDRPIPSLSQAEIDLLYASLRRVLDSAILAGGAYYEKDFYGRQGGYTADNWMVGYNEGCLCPKCGTPIEKIKTGSTSSYVCPTCQPL